MKLGILGGGQLGMMMGLAAYPLGIVPSFFDPSPESPAFQIGKHTCASFDDIDALQQFASSVDKITYEFENIPSQSLSFLSQSTLCSPSPLALSLSQDRLIEKNFLRTLGIPTADFVPVANERELINALRTLGSPTLLKTRTMGYDGKGQVSLTSDPSTKLSDSTISLLTLPCILEKKVAFEGEVSQIAVRDAQGNKRFYPLTLNVHKEGILRTSLAPAPDILPELASQAQEMVASIMDELLYEGVFTLEFFVTSSGLVANEFAPRVHNSGHWTIEGAFTSQFANHVRAVCGLPLGECSARGTSMMINLLGNTGLPQKFLTHSQIAYHSYHKAPRPLRKVGHITITAASIDEVRQISEPVLASL